MRTDIGTVPLVEEELVVEKKTVLDGRVEVRTHTREVEETAIAELLSRGVKVTRVAVDLVVDVAPKIRTEGDLTVVPVLEERLVVEKRLVLVEEIHIRQMSTTRKEKVGAILRKQDVSISRTSTEEQTRENHD